VCRSNNKPVLIYIGGYGRSGSSILEAALHTIINKSASLGEVAVILDSLQLGRLGCSCGSSNYSCTPWSKVRRFLKNKDVKENFKYYSKKEMIGQNSNSVFAENYGNFWMEIFRMRTQSNIIIDSSKTSYRYCNRALIMAESGCFDVFFIHVNRNIKGVLKSRSKGTNKQLSGICDTRPLIIKALNWLIWPISTATSWSVANYCAKQIYQSEKLAGRIKIDFQSIRSSPLDSAKFIASEIERQLKCTLDVGYSYIGPIVSGHSAEGNRSIRNLPTERS
jgi:hypothetical protein